MGAAYAGRVLDPHLTEEDVQTVLTAMEHDDPAQGRAAVDVWMALTAGEGPAMVSRAGLQNWLWWLLPKRSYADMYDYWIESAAAAAALFERLDCPAYAAICRSDTTARVLAAWHESRSKGLAATRRAISACPVEPPHLDDFRWGTVFGVWENDARSAVESALEQAFATTGPAMPVAKWKAMAATVCRSVLDADHPDAIGQSWRSLVASERAARWVDDVRSGGEIKAERERIAARFLAQPSPPDESVMRGALSSLAWLAEACRAGLTLTAAGYLPPAIVRDAAERFDWGFDWGFGDDKPPRSEADLYGLQLVHRSALKLGIVRRQGRSLRTTKAGATIAGDPRTWWHRLAVLGMGEQPYRDSVFEHTALAVLDAGTIKVEAVRRRLGERLSAEGWAEGNRPVTAESHGHQLYSAIRPWRVWGFIEHRDSKWGPTSDGTIGQLEPATIAATPAGRAAAELWLHRRVTGPRDRP